MISTTVWRLPEVVRQTGLSRSTIYQLGKRGDFPQQLQLGSRAVGGLADDVVPWFTPAEPVSGGGIQRIYIIILELGNVDDRVSQDQFLTLNEFLGTIDRIDRNRPIVYEIED